LRTAVKPKFEGGVYDKNVSKYGENNHRVPRWRGQGVENRRQAMLMLKLNSEIYEEYQNARTELVMKEYEILLK